MSDSSATCWTMVEGAADGRGGDRTEFATRYQPAIRAYLGARWRRSPLVQELDDAVQEVFVECFRGALDQADRDRSRGFRPYLYGIVRNVARRFEERRGQQREVQAEDEAARTSDDESLSDAFDRTWALAIMEEAGRLQERRARRDGPEAERRVALLRLRFEEGMPIREIARAWRQDPAVLHNDYRRARREFKAALLEVVSFHVPGARTAVERECAHLLSFF